MSAPTIQRGAGGTPAGASGAVQFNNAGAFGGFGNWDGSDFLLGSLLGDGYAYFGAGYGVIGADYGGSLTIRSVGSIASLLILGSAGGTFAEPTVSVNGDELGEIYMKGRSASGGTPTAARIKGWVDGVVSGSVIPGRLEIETTAAGGSGLPTERLRIDSKGGMTLVEEHANGADPAAPTAGGRLYCVQTAGGKTQLAVRFPSGAAQIIATEP